jgi:hypothetical protein
LPGFGSLDSEVLRQDLQGGQAAFPSALHKGIFQMSC